MRNTKVFRYSSGLRQAEGRARRPRQQGGSSPAGGPSPAPEEPPPASYADWISRHNWPTNTHAWEQMTETLDGHVDLPLISVIMPVFNPSEQHLRACHRIGSPGSTTSTGSFVLPTMRPRRSGYLPSWPNSKGLDTPYFLLPVRFREPAHICCNQLCAGLGGWFVRGFSRS